MWVKIGGRKLTRSEFSALDDLTKILKRKQRSKKRKAHRAGEPLGRGNRQVQPADQSIAAREDSILANKTDEGNHVASPSHKHHD